MTRHVAGTVGLKIRHARGLCAVAAAALVAALATGCANEEEMGVRNLPPETYLAVEDAVRNPTVYSQKLAWWGDDKDGEVIAFEYRWFMDPDEPGCRTDTAWVRTEDKSKVFDLPVTRGESVHRFEVRAIDNYELRDSTACKLTLPVTNSPPEVMIWDRASLPDTTFPAFTATWHGSDPEGDNTISKYMIWLDGSRDSARVMTPSDTVVSLGFNDFGDRCNTERTLNIIAIDSGCDTSEVATHTWYVREPRGRILLVDDLGREKEAFEAQSDAFYRSGLNSCNRDYSMLDLEKFGGLVSAHNFLKLLPQFDMVVWYNEPWDTASLRLPLAQAALRAYVEGGGRLLLASMCAIEPGGALQDSLWPDVFGVDSLFLRGSSTNFDCVNWSIQSNAEMGLDSLKVVRIWRGVECMLPLSGATPLYYIPPNTTNPKNKENYYLGIMNSWQAGKAAILTFPLSRSDGYGNARQELCRVIDLLLQ